MNKALLRSASDELKKHIRWACEQGWSVDRTAKNHLRFSREGCRATFFSGTPSDRRAILNHRSQLRNALVGVTHG